MTLGTPNFLSFFLAFGLLLAVARLLGEGARRLGQPAVLGELLAGIALGPSLLGSVLPGVTHWLFPATGSGAVPLALISQLGVILLLLLSGLETNLAVMRRQLHAAALIAGFGILVPLVVGFGVALALPRALIARPDQHLLFAAFLAIALSMSAIPVIVKILIDLDLLRRDVGQLILGAGTITDTVGWVLLAFVAGVSGATGAPVAGIAVALLGTVVLVVYSFTVGPRLLRRVLAWVDYHIVHDDSLLAAVLIVGLAGAALTQALHLEAFLGAFLVGVQLARIPRVHRAARAQLQALTLGIFAPLFFATAGLQVDLRTILTPERLVITVALIVVASLGKLAGVYLGARLSGAGSWLALALGAGLNARGAVEIIVASVGLQLGILTPATYAMVVVMAIATSLLAPPTLRWALRRVPIPPHEAERLRREAFADRSFLRGIGRVLVPVRDGRAALPAARIVARLASSREVDALALHVQRADADAEGSRPGMAPDGESARDALEATGDHWRYRAVEATGDVVPVILDEAERGYDLLVLGAATRSSSDDVFSRTADRVIAAAPCPVFALHLPPGSSDLTIRRIIVPTIGTEGDEQAAEFAVALAIGTGAELLAVHVIEVSPLQAALIGRDADPSAYLDGELATSRIRDLGELHGVPVRTQVYVGPHAGHLITTHCGLDPGDFILLAARRRFLGSGVSFGATVEYVVRHAHCPVGALFPRGTHAWSDAAANGSREGSELDAVPERRVRE
ncbi:MAG TPA: cation:proton antiporter [Thermomicrobiaceae bacterium]|nr:cation:proton antiporter [Thermomicrobiaceae bacterium]